MKCAPDRLTDDQLVVLATLELRASDPAMLGNAPRRKRELSATTNGDRNLAHRVFQTRDSVQRCVKAGRPTGMRLAEIKRAMPRVRRMLIAGGMLRAARQRTPI